MSRVDDKARFYLERAIPQLREFESKEIFSKDEIRTLVQKRAEFERILLSPGSKPSDVLAYIAWEQALDNLRRKRCQRLKIRQSTSHSSQARIFQTYERGVSRHPGSAALWTQYLQFAAQVKATKRWRRIMTRALRMLPSEPELWVLAGKKAAQDGDMEGARGFFMRGCRFCTKNGLVWVEYARAEMLWLARLEKKKGTPAFAAAVAAITGADAAQSKDDLGADEEGNIEFGGDDSEEEDDFGDLLTLPKSMTDAAKKKPAVFSDEAVQKLEKSPALDGAIPRAIFDVATKQPFFTATAAEAFFDMFAAYTHVAARAQIVDHVLQAMSALFPNAAATWNCQVKLSLVGVNPEDSAFPGAVRTALAALQQGLAATSEKAEFVAKSLAWLDALLGRDDLDAGVRMVLEDARRKVERA